MKNAFFSRALPALTLAAVAFASLPAVASPFTSLVVFGDSLSDDGNNALVIGTQALQPITNSYVPIFPYATGVYSNGSVWATDAASMLGVPLTPSGPLGTGGTDFAYGGATTGPLVSSFPFSLLTQASQYLTLNGNVASPNALYVVEGGGNDARAGLPGGIAAYLANIDTIVQSLKNAGAQHIVVWNTPNLALAPAVAGGPTAGSANALVLAMNAALMSNLANVADVSIFDIYGLGTSIFNDPAAFHLTNVTDACGGLSPVRTAANMSIGTAFTRRRLRTLSLQTRSSITLRASPNPPHGQ
jgi:outer membrane lipase/esterase